MAVAMVTHSLADAKVQVKALEERAGLSFMSWDTEGGSRADVNLLRKDLGVELFIRGEHVHTVALTGTREPTAPGSLAWRVRLGENADVVWSVSARDGKIVMTFSGDGAGIDSADPLTLRIPWESRTTPTNFLSSRWREDGSMDTEGLINAPDWGLMRMRGQPDDGTRVWMRSNYVQKSADMWIELPQARAGVFFTLTLEPFHLPAPAGVADDSLWALARRPWANAFQPVGLQTAPDRNPLLFPAGGLGNDVTTNTVSSSLWFYAGQAFWTPRIGDNVSPADMLRRTLDHTLDRRVLASGNVLTWSGYDPASDGKTFPQAAPHISVNYLDSSPSTLISAWCYVEATQDTDWLKRRRAVLERVATHLVGMDIDGDGLIESSRSGNRGSLVDPERGDSWWDAVAAGHKNAYLNLLTYRAFRLTADLERKLGRDEQAAYFNERADRLREAFHRTFNNPQTGWYGWWRSRDGELHDYGSPFINGMAIEYGLVDIARSRKILQRLQQKMKEVGFERFDLGVPVTLVPIPRDAYLRMKNPILGASAAADGSDGFQHYMNGSTNACFTLPYLAALYRTGDREHADFILRAMLQRAFDGGFQNGKQQAADQGPEWTQWDGTKSGADGFLADNYQFLQAVLLRESEMRSRWYRTLPLPGLALDEDR